MRKKRTITIENIEKYKIISLLIDNGIVLKDLQFSDKTISFIYQTKQKKKIIYLLTKNCLSFSFFDSDLFPIGIMSKLCLVVPILLLFAFYMFMSSYFLEYTISCDNEEVKSAISSYLENQFCGKTFVKKSDNLLLQLKTEILNLFSEISYCELNFDGYVLKVNAKLKLSNDEYINRLNFVDIVANVNGYIESVEVEQGRLCVNVGDYVSCGDSLISSKILDGNGNEIYVMPKGKIVIKTYKTLNKQILKEKIENVRTGNFVEQIDLSICGISFSNNKCDNKFKNYETTETIKCISTILPIYKKTTRFYETKEEVVVFDFEREGEEVLRIMKGEVEKDIGPQAYDLTFKCDVKNNGSMFDFNVYLKYYINVG